MIFISGIKFIKTILNLFFFLISCKKLHAIPLWLLKVPFVI